ncbi:hypothetical protein RJ640_013281 [Escallonia rubra]|uniref:DUF7653 domain-containing protein n=1 Tax=Escallonia rubra TaxID=112253 RepID=A0AA88R1K4_9ASTE|nr:hypothetical protein RJ640_013281 [Escallonia rubra]
MKKLFFFRSSASSNGNNSQVSPPSKDKQLHWENPADDNKSRTKKVSGSQTFDNSPCLRRSHSYSSGTVRDGGLGERNYSCSNIQNGSPSSSSSLKRSDPRSSCRRAVTPERHSKWFEAATTQNAREIEKADCVVSSRAQCDPSESSSYCSSNVSNKVLDRYIDGEQQPERCARKSNSPLRKNGNGGGKRPPRFQYTAPASPTDGMKQKPRSHSYRESKGSQVYFSTKEWIENGFGQESPRKLAKHVIERLSQSRVQPTVSSKEFDPDVPITIEDIYGTSFHRSPSLDSDGVSPRNSPLYGADESIMGDYHKDFGGLVGRYIPGDNCKVLSSVGNEEDIGVELVKKSKEAEERALILSEELEQENFLQDGRFNIPALIQTIRNLMEERVNLALEVSFLLRDQISERATSKEELKLARTELDSQTRRLEKEKNELQSALEKELDRRSSEWSLKLEKYHDEEHRLRERVRELAEQNVSLQRDVSSFSERELDSRRRISYSELQLKDLTRKVEETRDENESLQQSLSELQEKYIAAEEDRDCIRRNYDGKEKECKELHKSIARLLRTCSEQEKTIDGLRGGLLEEVRKKSFMENFDNQLGKLQMEQMRLIGVEQALRKEVDSYRQEVDSLRHENMSLLHRLKSCGKEAGSTFKLDQELWNRVCCLENQGLSLFNENIQLCTKLLEYTKAKAGHSSENKQGNEVIKNGLDGQFVVESEMKLQGFKRGAENLTRSLQTISVVLNEKACLIALDSPSNTSGDGLGLNDQSSEDTLRSELKAETLLTRLLREKLYSKELDLEQIQAELAAAVRGNDILRCEVQNALDTLSCVTHKMKELELQMIKKDENINRLQNDLQECSKELSIVRGILPKISEERDLMWEEVKQYSEKTMLLNTEVNVLKKKVEALDEDVLLKEGQITILKDSLGKPFDLLAGPDSTREFLLD